MPRKKYWKKSAVKKQVSSSSELALTPKKGFVEYPLPNKKEFVEYPLPNKKECYEYKATQLLRNPSEHSEMHKANSVTDISNCDVIANQLVSVQGSCTDSETTSPTAINDICRSEPHIQLIFGNTHQGSNVFGASSRGRQCTCNALISLCLSRHGNVKMSSDLDYILQKGDSLYKSVTSELRRNKDSHHEMLMIDELPNCVLIDQHEYTIQKVDCYTGMLNEISDPSSDIYYTFSEATCKAFQKYATNLLIVGSYCLALYRTLDNKFAVFDSHSHGPDGMHHPDGRCMIHYFDTLTELLRFMNILFISWEFTRCSPFELQGLKISVNTNVSASDNQLMTSYFEYQSKCQQLHENSVTKEHGKSEYNTNVKMPHAVKFDKRMVLMKPVDKRRIYLKEYKRKQRENPSFRNSEKQKQLVNKQKKRLNPAFKESEANIKQKMRQNPAFRKSELELKQKLRQNVEMRSAERHRETKLKQRMRQNPAFRKSELELKQKLRQDPAFRKSELDLKQKMRQNPAFRKSELELKQKMRQDTAFRKSELELKQKMRQNPAFRKSELELKQKMRQDAAFRKSELELKQKMRQNVEMRSAERHRETKLKQRMRQNPAFRKSELELKQKMRQNVAFRKFELHSKQK
ncbi:uncharacterized protein [Ptychodera flava]|uniref:uncharacterized protein n=1 Tax=Ptychodera flava TaxID=63121 RepID=UPI003969FC50